MRVHYFQHVSFENLALIELWLIDNGHKISVTKFYEPNYIIPPLNDIDALIVMGGSMGALDDEKYNWLKTEKDFIKTCINERKKVLGICLGAQLIAACLGAGIQCAPYKEIGWYTITPTEECKKYSWFYDLFKDNPTVFHWHGDQFEIPNKTVNLISSEANINQAFIYNDTVIALQFHLEVEKANVVKMIECCLSDLDERQYIQGITDLVIGTKHTINCRKLIRGLLDNFIGSDNL